MHINIKTCFSSESPKGEHNKGHHHPCISLVMMDHIVSYERWDQTADTDDDDSNYKWESSRVDRSEGLTTQNDSSCCEAEPWNFD